MPAPVRRTLVLDTEGVVKWAWLDQRVSAMIDGEILAAGSRLVIPSAVLVEAARAGVPPDRILEVVRTAHEVTPIDVPRALEAANLLNYSAANGRDVGVVDALVAAEALRSIPSIVLTSDDGDIRLLCDSDASSRARIAIWHV